MMKYVVTALLGLAAVATAASNTATYCVPEQDDVCFSVHVPDASESSNQTGDLYMQIRAPATMSWVGLGQSPLGMMMGSNMFVVYASQDDSSGYNVTLSPRLGQGHFMPLYDHNSSQVSLLPSSGVSDGVMVADIKCQACQTWTDGGSMSLSDSASTWIYAFTPGSMRSDNVSARIAYHQSYGVFRFNLPDATGGSGEDAALANPFAGLELDETTTASTKDIKFYNPSVGAMQSRMLIAHAVLMALAFGLLYPATAMLMRLYSSAHTWLIHASIQLVALAMSIAGMGIGIYFAVFYDSLTNAHVLIGLVVVSLLCLMPFAGLLQHVRFVQLRRRTWWGRGHAYLGRALVALGIINGGIGLQWTGEKSPATVRAPEIAYGVLTGVIGLSWIAVVLVTAFRRRRGTGGAMADRSEEASQQGEAQSDKRPSSASESDVERVTATVAPKVQ